MKQDLEFPEEFSEIELSHEKIKYDGTKELVRYKLGKPLGEGGFALCYKCCGIKDKKIKIYAAKEIDVENSPKDKIENEILIYKELRHKNIVKLYDNFSYNKKYYLMFEYCENKDLSALLENRGKLKEIEVQYYIYQLIQALIHLQERNIIHRDIKSKNIFLTEKLELKLGDFGLARMLNYPEAKCYDFAGTLGYMAPEIVEKKSYTLKADIWPIGVIMYELLLGELPFNGKAGFSVEDQIKNVNYKFPDDAIISNAARDLITQILVYDPEQRPSLYQILEHDFFKIGDSIPEKLPKCFKEKPPSLSYIKNFMEEADDNGIVHRKVSTTNLKSIEINRPQEKIINKNNTDIYAIECRMIKKYGLGYRLNNNNFGVCFNDNSKIIQNQNNTNKFFYMENKEDGRDYESNEQDMPRDVQKKYNILQGFINILSYKEKYSFSHTSQNGEIEHQEINDNEKTSNCPIFVKQYFAYDNESILLRFNNKTIQIYFLNGENILLSKDEKDVTFIRVDNERLERSTYRLDEVMESQNFEIIRKLQYSKSLLEKILTK